MKLLQRFSSMPPWHLLIVLLVVACFVGIVTYDDYGSSTDEAQQHTIGKMAYDYAFRGDDAYLSFVDRDYGVAFELPLYALQTALGTYDVRDIHITRHIATYAFYLLSLVFLYLLVTMVLGNGWWGIVAVVWMYLTPRMFTHAFINQKDIPLMCAMIIALYTLMRVVRTYSYRDMLWHGAASALVMNMRIVGVLMVAITVGVLIVDMVLNKEKRFRIARLVGIYLTSSAVLLYVIWPYLWEAPFDHFIAAWKNMSKFRFDADVHYMGQYYKSSTLPWHFIPVWFVISTPIVYLASFVMGMVALFTRVRLDFMCFLKNGFERNITILLGYFLLPIIMVIVMGSILYDSWRHLYFIYPGFLIIAVFGVRECLRFVQLYGSRYVPVVIGLYVVVTVLIIVPIVRHHPYQYVFFNRLVSHAPNALLNTWEMDYWGVSYLCGYRYIIANDDRETIRFKANSYSGYQNIDMLPYEQRKRFIPEDDQSKADYFITDYRDHPREYDDVCCEVFSLSAHDSKVLSVFELD